MWVPRKCIQKADSLSRCSDSDDWKINRVTFNNLHKAWGPYTCDRFASTENAQCDTFNSRWWWPSTSDVDAFKQSWVTDCNWMVPPPMLITKVINKLVSEKSKGTLVIPQWKSAPFWKQIYEESKFRSFVKDFRVLHPNVIKRGRGNNGIFGNRKIIFKLIALKIAF